MDTILDLVPVAQNFCWAGCFYLILISPSMAIYVFEEEYKCSCKDGHIIPAEQFCFQSFWQYSYLTSSSLALQGAKHVCYGTICKTAPFVKWCTMSQNRNQILNILPFCPAPNVSIFGTIRKIFFYMHHK